ncbi:murein L,D-transpeptidase catalytic domain family protein [Pseudobdellovibrio sp. HCB154]|uniref:murein L,D-transpeptidase catalytic domain family protein n=1 Tax=Pseudobdellovibrio sp. HCB154 TaxID=3386277 RepID=UPI0039173E3D
MKKLIFLTTLFVTLQSFAANFYDLKIEGESIFNRFVKQGAPAIPLKRIYDYLNANAGKATKVAAKDRSNKAVMSTKDITVKGDWIAIIDFTKPSDVRRLYVMNVKTGQFTAHHVAHGKGSGVRFATKFSNINNSKMSSLGLYLGGSVYSGGHGASLNLHGLDPSNNKAAERDVVMHAANYVSDKFLKQTGRLGRSWGCPAVSTALMKRMNADFSNGGVIYAYHKDLAEQAMKTGKLLEDKTINDDADVDYDGEEETVRKSARKAPVAGKK